MVNFSASHNLTSKMVTADHNSTFIGWIRLQSKTLKNILFVLLKKKQAKLTDPEPNLCLQELHVSHHSSSVFTTTLWGPLFHSHTWELHHGLQGPFRTC